MGTLRSSLGETAGRPGSDTNDCASRATSHRGVDEDFFTGEPQVLTGRTCHRKIATMVIPSWSWELGGQSRADPGPLGESYEQHCTPPFLLRLQGLLTLFTEFFASFDHSTSALSVPGLYASLRRIHVALQTAVPSHSTRGCSQPHPDESQCTAKHTGQSPCSVGPFQVSSWHWDHLDAANRSKAHSVCWNPTKADRDKHHVGVAWSQESHFQEEPWVLLVHSPLLQQSRLLAVPPLSDMLKFGGSFHVRQVTDPRLSGQKSFLDHIREAGTTYTALVGATQHLLPSAINCWEPEPPVSDQRANHEPAMVTSTEPLWGQHSPPLVIALGETGVSPELPLSACSLLGNTDAQAAQGETLRWPVAFRAVPLYRSQDSAYHRTYHEAAVSFIRTWAKTSTTTGPNIRKPHDRQ